MSANFSRIDAACSSKLTARGWTFSSANVRTCLRASMSCIESRRETKSMRTGRVMTRETDSARMASMKAVRFWVRRAAGVDPDE